MCVYLHWFIYLLYKGMKNRQDGFSYVSPYDDFFTVISDDNLCKHNTLSGKIYGTPCINTYTYIMLTYHGMFFSLTACCLVESPGTGIRTGHAGTGS